MFYYISIIALILLYILYINEKKHKINMHVIGFIDTAFSMSKTQLDEAHLYMKQNKKHINPRYSKSVYMWFEIRKNYLDGK